MRTKSMFVLVELGVVGLMALLINAPTQASPREQIVFGCQHGGINALANAEICIMDADGNNLRRLTNHPAGEHSPTGSPDGRKIAFMSNRDGNWEIYIMDANGKNPRNLTNHPTRDSFPAWSPDGGKSLSCPIGMGTMKSTSWTPMGATRDA